MKEKLLFLVLVAIIVPIVPYLLLGQSGPTVSISRLYNLNLQSGDTVGINVTVSDVSDMTSLRMNLAWDPKVLRVTTGDPEGWRDEITGVKYDIYEGPFLKSFTNSTMFIINDVNNNGGNITALYNAIIAANVTASGSGVISTINFTCVNSGTTTVRIVPSPGRGQSSMQSSTGEQVLHRDIDGVVTSGGSPGIWAETWFQVALGVVIFEIVVVVLAIFLIVRWWRLRSEEEIKEEAELKDLVR